MSTNLDLRQLRVDRDAPDPPSTRRSGRRHLLSRYVLPGAVVLGFLAVIFWAARDSLLPSTPVMVVPVVMARAEVQEAGTPLFQAAGWIEPRPSPVVVSSLAEGVIEKILVVEGQEVQAGQPVAKLIDTDARIALEKTQADLQLKEAEQASAQAELAAARTRIEQPVHLEAALAEADSFLAQAETELAKLPFEARAAGTRVELARKELKGKETAGAAVAERLVQRAEGELQSALAQLEEVKQRGPHLEKSVATLRRRCDALKKQLELKIDETRQLADAEAKVKAAEARHRQAELAVQTATLQLERTTIRAPLAGRVLRIAASPGARVMGINPQSAQDASTVLSLYDPKMLQVRADVRLEDVARVQPGQPVRIETASVPGPIQGRVLMVTSQASVQKNTIEVKVALDDPPPAIRPEMLVQATFMAADPPTGKGEAAAARERLLVPRQLVEKTEAGAALWVADPAGIARRQPIELGRAGTPQLVEVIQGLNATDKIISTGREGLRHGQRIRIAGEMMNDE